MFTYSIIPSNFKTRTRKHQSTRKPPTGKAKPPKCTKKSKRTNRIDHGKTKPNHTMNKNTENEFA